MIESFTPRPQRVIGVGVFVVAIDRNSAPGSMSTGKPFACARLPIVSAMAAFAGSTMRFAGDVK